MPPKKIMKSALKPYKKPIKRKLQAKLPVPSKKKTAQPTELIELTDSESDYYDYFPLLYGGTSGEEDPELSSPNEDDFAVIHGAITVRDLMLKASQGIITETCPTDIPSVIDSDIQEESDDAEERLWSRDFLTQISATRNDVLEIVKEMTSMPHLRTPDPSNKYFKHLDEDTNKPFDFATEIEKLLSYQKIVIVACLAKRDMFLDLDYLYQHFALSPDEIVAVSGCDTNDTTQMTFRDYVNRYEQDKLSIHEHPVRRSDMPIFLEHLDHGYAFGWGSYLGSPVDRPYLVEQMHSSLQCYPSTFLKPYYWRERAPGCAVAIHVRSGMLVLRVFCPPRPKNIQDRHDYFKLSDEIEQDKSTCIVVELLAGEMIIFPPGIIFDIYSPVPTMATTTCFLNYSCLHLTEMTKCRDKFKTNHHSNCKSINQVIYNTMVRMLGVLQHVHMDCIPVKPLIALCSLVAYPSYYHLVSTFPDVGRVQETNDWLFQSGMLGKQDMDSYDIPGHFEYLPESFEIESLAIANRFLEYARSSGITVAVVVCDGEDIIIDVEEDLVDFHFMWCKEFRVWSWPACKLDDAHWNMLILGL